MLWFACLDPHAKWLLSVLLMQTSLCFLSFPVTTPQQSRENQVSLKGSVEFMLWSNKARSETGLHIYAQWFIRVCNSELTFTQLTPYRASSHSHTVLLSLLVCFNRKLSDALGEALPLVWSPWFAIMQIMFIDNTTAVLACCSQTFSVPLCLIYFLLQASHTWRQSKVFCSLSF